MSFKIILIQLNSKNFARFLAFIGVKFQLDLNTNVFSIFKSECIYNHLSILENIGVLIQSIHRETEQKGRQIQVLSDLSEKVLAEAKLPDQFEGVLFFNVIAIENDLSDAEQDLFVYVQSEFGIQIGQFYENLD